MAGSTQPSLKGPFGGGATPPAPRPDGPKNEAAGIARRAAIDEAPRASAYFTPAASRSASVAFAPTAFPPSRPGPLSAIARTNSPFASGDFINDATDSAPDRKSVV